MDEVDIEVVAEPDLRDPLLVEGLPGVGHVGKLAAEHLIEERDGELVRRVYTSEFPPQVTVGDDGTTELTHAAFHAVDVGDRDAVVLTGDHQAGSNAGHYRLTEAFLDVAESLDVSEVFAMGGVPTGELVEDPSVLGAATDVAFVEALEDVGVEFRDNEPAGGIVGVSGLLLGLGERRGLPAACLMGETSGYLVDPKSARAVLEVLSANVGFELGYDQLEDRAEEMEEVMSKLQEMEQGGMDVPSDDELRYIG